MGSLRNASGGMPRRRSPVGVEIEGLVAETSRSLVYRARKGPLACMLEICRVDDLDDDARVRRMRAFMREAAILSVCEHPNIISLVAAGDLDDVPYMICERVDGGTLEKRMLGARSSAEDVVRLGIALSSALAAVHLRGFVHRDVSPRNIAFDADGRAKLGGFHHAMRAGSCDRPALVGALAYASPEQTGAVKREVDLRSDLFSLGAVLYECATGRPPFMAESLAQLLHEHAAERETPADVLNPAIGRDLADVIRRLLAKDPDDRYANAERAIEDLASIDGSRGSTSVPRAATVLPMVGRRRILERLSEARRNVDSGRGELMLLYGGDGIGKTRVLDAFVRANAGSALVSCAISEDSLEPRSTCDQLADAVSRASHRTIALDDAEHIDGATLDFVRAALEEHGARACLVLLAVRGERPSDEPIPTILRALEASRRVEELLPPLELEEIDEMARGLLGRRTLAPELVSRISAASHGKPGAIVEYVAALLDAGALIPTEHAWRFDATEIDRVMLPSVVVDSIERWLSSTTSATRDLLCTAAVMGSPFASDALASVAEETEESVERALRDAARANVVDALGDGTWKFVHDRAHQAFLEKVDAARARTIHERVADYLYSVDPKVAVDVFAVARHYSLGTRSRPDRALDANSRAGVLALERAAPDRAYFHLSTALEIARDAGIERAELHRLLGHACVATQRVSEALEHLETALASSRDPVEHARLREAKGRAHVLELALDRAKDEVRRGLDELGAADALGPTRRSASETVAWAFAKIGLSSLTRAGPRPIVFEPRLRAIAGMFELSWMIAVFGGDGRRALEAADRRRSLAHALGDDELAVRATSERRVGLSLMGEALAEASRAPAAPTAFPKTQLTTLLDAREDFARAIGGMPCDVARALAQARADDDVLSGDAELCWLRSGVWAAALLRGHEKVVCGAWDASNEDITRVRDGVVRDVARLLFSAALVASGEQQRGNRLLQRIVAAHPRHPSGLFRCAIAACELSNALHEEDDEGVRRAMQRFEAAEEGGVARGGVWGIFHVLRGHASAERFWASVASARSDARAGLHEASRTLDAMAVGDVERAHASVVRAVCAAADGRHGDALSELEAARVVAERVDAPWIEFEILRHRAEILRAQGLLAAATRAASLAAELARGSGWPHRERKIRQRFEDVRAPELSRRETTRGSAYLEPSDDADILLEAVRVRRQLDALMQIGLSVGSSVDAGEQADVALLELARILNAERAFLLLESDDGAGLSVYAGRGPRGNELDALEEHGMAIARRVFASGRPEVMTGADLGRSGRTSGADVEIRSIIAAPMIVRDEVVGVAYLDTRIAKGMFTEDDTEILSSVANYLGVGLLAARARQAEFERRSLELRARELEQEKGVAEESARVKAQFLANMSHEIRTPMNGIVGVAQLLGSTPLSEEQREYVATIRTSAEALIAIINDVLDFSKIEAGKLTIEAVVLRLSDIVEEVRALLVAGCLQKGLELSTHVDALAAHPVIGDPSRIRQILLNLTANAIKFTERGTIAIRVDASSRGDDRIAARISIRDTGIGIRSEDQAKLFAEFVQADTSTTRNYGGTGLGLAITKQLVELMGGEIHFTSAVGDGTTFVVELAFERAPVAKDTELRAPERGTTVSRATARFRARALVVDDNPVNRRLSERMLERLGCLVDVAEDGGRGVGRFSEEGPYDIVFMDCQMPTVDGYEATREIRRLENGRRTPIVALTSHAMESERIRCIDAGMDDHLAKPVKIEDFERSLTTWVRHTQVGGEG